MGDIEDRLIVGVTAIALMMAIAPHAHAQQAEPSEIRIAVAKSIELLQKTAVSWYKKQTCTSCHQQDLPMMVLASARERGIAIDAPLQRQAIIKGYGFLRSVDRAVQQTNLIDPSMDYGMRLLGAQAAGIRPSLTTGIYARLIANRQLADGGWITIDERPPQAHSRFTATAVALRAIQLYMPAQLKSETSERIGPARRWLETNEPTTTEDRIFQLRGLAWSGAAATTIDRLARALLDQQRPDGGWSQLPRLESDAYATGETLAVLHEAAQVATSDPAWQRGVRFLLSTQRPDGSWLVRSRLHEQKIVSPPYFESGFPHGPNQMISALGTSWATFALLDGIDPSSGARPPTARAAVIPLSKPWMTAAAFGTPADLEKLLDAGLSANTRTLNGTTILMMAAHDPRKVRLLLDRGADANAVSKTGYTALMIAANYRGASESVRLLLDHDAAIHPARAKPVGNASAAAYGVLSGDLATARLLAARGADFREKMNEVRPLDIAVQQRDVPMIRFLVSAGVNVNEEDTDTQISALTWAAIENDLPTARALIELGADANKRDKLGMTPLLHAASIDFGDVEMVKLLLASGADPRVQTQANVSAEQLAMRYGHSDIARAIAGAR